MMASPKWNAPLREWGQSLYFLRELPAGPAVVSPINEQRLWQRRPRRNTCLR